MSTFFIVLFGRVTEDKSPSKQSDGVNGIPQKRCSLFMKTGS